eukprot:TRINITY_DN92523_c0_g1_i1.p2 TRINITY_DN92523_c0_g1~~TRINITY_DN92523_c0_g1_i1.p2  ORF type:complete len:102 (-),score=13.03 TRINITY_DN92523_c0_g1_i1:99-404(-)
MLLVSLGRGIRQASILHVFFCQGHLELDPSNSWNFPLSLSPASLWNVISSNCDSIARQAMASVFMSTTYFLWKARNEYTFNSIQPYITRIKKWIIDLLLFQ